LRAESSNKTSPYFGQNQFLIAYYQEKKIAFGATSRQILLLNTVLNTVIFILVQQQDTLKTV